MRAIALILALAGSACALTVDEVVQLSEAGLADDIILEQMKADGSAFELSAAEIIHLQRKKVSPVVIRYMVSARDREALPADAGGAVPVPGDAPAKSTEVDDAGLTVRNLSRGILSVMTRRGEREIVLVHGEIAGVTVLRNGSRAELALPSGLYRIRWADEEPFRELAIASNVTTELEFRDDDRFPQGVRAVAIIDGKEEADPYAVPATEAAGLEAEDSDDGAGEVVVMYEDGGEPVWDGHAFIEVASHVHGGQCGHWYYDNCWNFYPQGHVYTQLGYSRCGDTGGFHHDGVSYARVWDGWVFSFLRAHIHGIGCGHFYHHGCWNVFSHHHRFSEHGRGHFNPSPPRRRVPVPSAHSRSGASRAERSSGASAPRRHSELPAGRASEPARRVAPSERRQEPQRVIQPPKRQEPQRVMQPPKRQEPQRVAQPPKRQEPQRVAQPPKRQEPRRVVQPPKRQEPQRVAPQPKRPEPRRVVPQPNRQQPQRVEQPARRESPQGRSSPRQRQPENNSRGKRR